MYSLVDLENVSNRGFDGAELLTAGDTVVVFCSRASHFLFGGTWSGLVESGCVMELYELEEKGCNALDFSIVSYVGELYGKEPTAIAAIVSKDKGYKVCIDYWMERTGRQLLLTANILHGIRVAGNGERQQRARVFEKKIDVCEKIPELKRQRRVGELLEQELRARNCLDALSFCLLECNSERTPKQRYQDSLSTYGWGKGQEVYRAIKATIVKMEVQ